MHHTLKIRTVHDHQAHCHHITPGDGAMVIDIDKGASTAYIPVSSKMSKSVFPVSPPPCDEARCEPGLRLVLKNRFADAESFFEAEAHTSLQHSSAYACMSFMRAVLSQDASSFDAAWKRIGCTRSFATSLAQRGMIRDSWNVPLPVVRARLILADCSW